LTGTEPAFQVYQPKNGIHMSSRFRMKAGSSKRGSSAKVSHRDWCLDAMRSPPCGIFSFPRISIFVPASTRRSHRDERAQSFVPLMKTRRGTSMAGSSRISQMTRLT
jgi:hypothetical protein